MPTGLFQKIIDDLAEMGFTGRISPHLYGEPLADSRLPSLIEYAHTRLPQTEISILTNGDLLTTSVLEQLHDVGVHSYFVTIHDEKADAKERAITRIVGLMRYAKFHNLDIKLDYQTLDGRPLYNRGGLLAINGPLLSPSCMRADNPLVINYRGDVLLCCNDYLGEVIFGNLLHESLLDVWMKPEFVHIRHELSRKICTLDICKRCTGAL